MSLKKTITVDPHLCIGCQTCVLLDPQTFQMNSKTQKAEVKKQPQNFKKITKDTRIAIESCPQKAIKINNS